MSVISTTQGLNDVFAQHVPADEDIRLKPGDYSCHFTINQANTVLSSAQTGRAMIGDYRDPPDNRGVNFTVVINADNVTLRNLRFTGKNAISLRINGDNCTLENLVFEDVMMGFVAAGKNLTFKNITVRRFSEDGMRLASDGFHGENIRIEDLYAAHKEAHHDGIQLYAGDPDSPLRSGQRYEGRYAVNKGYLKNVQIRSTTDVNRSHIGQLQGIFASDGFMDGLHFEDIYVETHNCLHGVSIRGLRTAQDGVPACFRNINVRQTPGISSNTVPRINMWPARRLSHAITPAVPEGVRAKPVAVVPELAEDESNLQDVLFPPAEFRTELVVTEPVTMKKSVSPASPVSAGPGPSMWREIANGEMDELQNRAVIYEPLLELGLSPVYQRLIAR